jgi:aldose 1-epimerase
LASVDQTPWISNAVAIGTRLESNFQQLKYGSGYDHNWVINTAASGLNFAASITSPFLKLI